MHVLHAPPFNQFTVSSKESNLPSLELLSIVSMVVDTQTHTNDKTVQNYIYSHTLIQVKLGTFDEIDGLDQH